MSQISRPLDRLLADQPPSLLSKLSHGQHVPRRTRIALFTAGAIAISFLLFGHYSHNYGSRTIAFGEFNHELSKLPVHTPEHLSSTTIPRTVTTTVYAPTATETVTVYKDSPSATKYEEFEPVVFALLAWSESSGAELSVLIKSILMYITGPVELHILCDEAAKAAIDPGLSLIHSPTYEVKVRYYMPTWDEMVARLEREGSLFTEHSAGTPGLMKLFLHEIMPVKKAIFVDTDALFISDPRYLWNEFKSFKSSAAISMTYHSDLEAPEWHHANRICSCVMLLDFEKLREMRLMDSSLYRLSDSSPKAAAPAAFRAMFGSPDPRDGKYHSVRLGDQGYWWAIVDYFKDLWEPLSFDYEVSSCLLEMYETRLGEAELDEEQETIRQGHVVGTPQYGKIVRPKLLHFNCLHGADRWWEWTSWSDPENKFNRGWGAAVQYHVGFKWIWLNRFSFDSPKPKVDIQIAETLFEDQKFAKEHSIPYY
ncbi:hypothetical protein DL96DRAFT_1816461 [Flagelloscypha sp. PMI_526]|nr:hypothetical protein DL96DRAFT_1816461 [Flagelloscypha sp. PMI_526]